MCTGGLRFMHNTHIGWILVGDRGSGASLGPFIGLQCWLPYTCTVKYSWTGAPLNEEHVDIPLVANWPFNHVTIFFVVYCSAAKQTYCDWKGQSGAAFGGQQYVPWRRNRTPVFKYSSFSRNLCGFVSARLHSFHSIVMAVIKRFSADASDLYMCLKLWLKPKSHGKFKG